MKTTILAYKPQSSKSSKNKFLPIGEGDHLVLCPALAGVGVYPLSPAILRGSSPKGAAPSNY